MAALEDKIVQRGLATVLNAIWEEDFLGLSYGFRPGRGPHDALDALAAAIETRKVNFILDADLSKYLDPVSYCPLVHDVCAKRLALRSHRARPEWLPLLQPGYIVSLFVLVLYNITAMPGSRASHAGS